MTNCETCGRPPENGQPTHWLGCEVPAQAVAELDETLAAMCEFGECAQPKWSNGPRTKFCVDHKDPKSREK